MGSAVLHAPALTELGCAYVGIDSSQTGIGLYVIEPHFLHLDGWVRMPQIEKGTGWAHGPESTCSNYIYFLCSAIRPQFCHDVRHLFCRNYMDAAVSDFSIDVLYCFTSHGNHIDCNKIASYILLMVISGWKIMQKFNSPVPAAATHAFQIEQNLCFLCEFCPKANPT